MVYLYILVTPCTACLCCCSVSRTAVIDDEMDYFSVESNRWLSRGERGRLGEREGQLKEDRHGRKKKTTVTLDFAGRRVVEDNHKTGI